MAAICGCAQRAYNFESTTRGDFFRTCHQCGTAWAFTLPGWWRKVDDHQPEIVEPAGATRYDATQIPEYDRHA